MIYTNKHGVKVYCEWSEGHYKEHKKVVLKPNIKAHRKLINQEIQLYDKIYSLKGDLDEAKLRPLFEKMLSAMAEAEESVCNAQCNAIKNI